MRRFGGRGNFCDSTKERVDLPAERDTTVNEINALFIFVYFPSLQPHPPRHSSYGIPSLVFSVFFTSYLPVENAPFATRENIRFYKNKSKPSEPSPRLFNRPRHATSTFRLLAMLGCPRGASDPASGPIGFLNNQNVCAHIEQSYRSREDLHLAP